MGGDTYGGRGVGVMNLATPRPASFKGKMWAIGIKLQPLNPPGSLAWSASLVWKTDMYILLIKDCHLKEHLSRCNVIRPLAFWFPSFVQFLVLH